MIVYNIKRLLLLLLLTAFLPLFFSVSAEAQVTVNGKVADQQDAPLPSANILLLDAPDSTMVKGGITGEKGRFTFKNISKGTYLVSVSMVGFQKHLTDHFEVGQQPVNLGTITMKDTVQKMGQVSVEARKPLFEQEIDRLVVNVQRSITSAGSSVLEVLEKSPGVQVNRQSNSLSLNGQSGVRVMINGKIQRLPIDAVIQMLNGMNASNVEEIELISTPPAKYEAEGTAGLINIKMKQHASAGYQGTVGTEAGYNWAETLGGNTNLRYRRGKVAFFANYSINYNHNQNFFINERAVVHDHFNEVNNSHNRRRYTLNVQNLRTGLEYDVGSNTTVELLLGGYRRLWKSDDVIDIYNRPAQNQSLSTEMQIDERNDWKSALVNAGVDHSFSENRSLSFDVDYLYYENHNPFNANNNFIEGEKSLMDIQGLKTDKRTPINVWVSKLDYSHKVSDALSFETGLKGTLSSFFNDVDVSEKTVGNWVKMDRFSREADLSEHIGAWYLSASWQPLETWQVNSGLRYEYTDTHLSTPDQGGVVDRQNGHLFPTLHVEKELSDKQSIGFSYTRRITRPAYTDLAPFVYFNGPRTLLKGNPSLKAAISDGFELDYQQNNWIFSLEYSYTNNKINSFQPTAEGSGMLSYRTENLDYQNTYSASLNFPLSPADWWQVQSNLAVRYHSLKTSHLQNNRRRNGTSLSANITNTWDLPAGFTFEASGFYRSTAISGIRDSHPMGNVTAGLQKKILDGQGTLRLAMNDIFRTYILKSDANIPGQNVDSFFKYDINAQSINLTFTYNFGSSDIGDVDVETGSSEEQGRVNTN